MLNISDDALMVQVSSDVSTQYMLQQLTGDRRERDRAVVSWVTTGSLLEYCILHKYLFEASN